MFCIIVLLISENIFNFIFNVNAYKFVCALLDFVNTKYCKKIR